MKERHARCSCGSLSLICRGEPALVSLCHCRECQRRTGSTYGIAAFFVRSEVEISGEATAYRREADSGFDVTQHFCPRCGSTVYWEPLRKAEMIAVAVGAFADPDFPAPGKQVYPQHRHPWVAVPVD
ncbi:GFA family protein [Bosea sp. LjRoot237]|uniref:GFA family protein n=1 Tax=Bosea sp. LjRoot237 TaxID=3342292 RepID=UPI003ECFCD25